MISDGLAGFTPSRLGGGDLFGSSLAGLADLDGDSVNDLAVGAFRDENTQTDEGAVCVLLMNSDGTVKSHVKISDGLAGFTPSGLDGDDWFGSSVANLGDLDGDGVIELAVGARRDGNTDPLEGAVYIVSLAPPDSTTGLDNVAPGLISFARDTPATTSTNADTLVFLATFNEDVTGVDTGDFAVDGATSATISNVTPVTASTDQVTISGGDLATFSGVVGLNLAGVQDITDLVGNGLSGGEPATDETYTLIQLGVTADNASVTVNEGDTGANPMRSAPLQSESKGVLLPFHGSETL
jgi:hypothetical protein